MNKQIFRQVAENTDLPEEVVECAYKSFWEFIKNTIEGLPLKEDLSIEELKLLRTNFNIPSLGKLYCLPTRIIKLKTKYNNGKKRMDILRKTSN